jgi:hypothetical protein
VLPQAVDNISAVAPALGLDTTYPFPLERITLQAPPGTSGWSDVSVKVPSGTGTAGRSFQYLAGAQSYSKPGFFRFLAYDQSRQRVYLTNIDHVEVFDLQLGAFIAPLEPPGGPPPNAGLRGLSLTPDASELLVADFGAQSVCVLNPDTGSGITIAVGGVPGSASSGPSRVAATSTQTAFVGLSAEGGSGSGCATCLSQMDLSVSPPIVQTAPQQVSSLVGAPLLQGNSAGDHVVLAFGENATGKLAAWDASSPGQFKVSPANVAVQDIANTVDGTASEMQTATTTEIRDSSRYVMAVPTAAELNQVPGRVAVPGLAMHPTGALIYQPFLTGAAGAPNVRGGVDISDARSGQLRMRIFLPQQLMTDVDALHGDFLTIDENGQRLFAITSLDGSPQNAALTVVQLASVPLALGSVSSPTISRERFSSGDQGSRRRQARNGKLGGYEHTERGFAGGADRFPAVNANQCERRDCYSGRRGHRQLVTNFSRLASSKLTTTSTYSFWSERCKLANSVIPTCA